MSAVTFDFGQTLAELDHELLARRLAEHDVVFDVAQAARGTPDAWTAYGRAKQKGLAGREAWCVFMRTLLDLARVPGATDRLTEWLYAEQTRVNLWRKPIPGMIELCADLGRCGVPVGIISNSEGRLSELLEELGWSRYFSCVADSGKLGLEKPDPRIFHWAAERLGVATEALIHVGDVWETDVEGALAAGARAVWFAPRDPVLQRMTSARIVRCDDAAAVRHRLVGWGIRIVATKTAESIRE
jgi:HAD superfamily hydrolase (TIGR01549 family)